MTYPEIDATIINEATEALTKILTANEATKQAIEKLQATLKAATEERHKLLDLVAGGNAVPAKKTADIETTLRETEVELLRQQDILVRQDRLITEAEQTVRRARGLAHHLRLAGALVELRAGAEEKAVAYRAMNRADKRIEDAKAVVLEAFHAGFPPAPGIAVGAISLPDLDRLFFDNLSEHNLRQIWGAIAEKAFGPVKPAEAA